MDAVIPLIVLTSMSVITSSKKVEVAQATITDERWTRQKFYT